MLGGPWQDVGRRHPERGRIGEEALEPALGDHIDPLTRRRSAADDLVVDIGDVHHPRDRVPAPAQVSDEQVAEQERPKVADVGRAVYRRAARVDADMARLQRHQRPGLPRERVVQSDGHRSETRAWRRRAPRSNVRRPRRPSRLPVEALTLTAARSRPRRSASPADMASRWPARRGRAATIVTSTEVGRQPPASSRRLTSGEELATVDASRRPRVRREEPAEIAQTGGTQQRVGDCVERDIAVGMTVEPRRARDLDATEPQRHPRPERMAVVADPGPPAHRHAATPGNAGWPPEPETAARPAIARGTSPGTVTLRFPGSPWTT